MNAYINPQSRLAIVVCSLRRMSARIACIALLAGLSIAASAQSTIKIHGAPSIKSLIDTNLAEIKSQSGVTLEVVGNGSDNGLLDLVEGRADVAVIATSLEELSKKLNLKNPGTVDIAKLKSIPLGFTQFVLIVNTNNPVRRLTDAQAAGLLSGKITNWKEVGGDGLAVMVVATPPSSPLRFPFESRLLNSGQFTRDTKEVSNTRQIRVEVSQNIRAIGPLSAAMLSDKVAALTLDTEFQVPVFFIVRGEPSPEVLKAAEAVRPFIK